MVQQEYKRKNKQEYPVSKFLSGEPFQRTLIGILTLLAVFFIISSGAAPKRYKVELGNKSDYDINAPRDIENTVKTEENALKMAEEIPPVVKEIEASNASMINRVYDFFDWLEEMNEEYSVAEDTQEATNKDIDVVTKVRNLDRYSDILGALNDEQVIYLLKDTNLVETKNLKNVLTKNVMPEITSKKIYNDSLEQEISDAAMTLDNSTLKAQTVQIGKIILTKIIIPNSRIDYEETEKARQNRIEQYKKEYPVIVYKDERIISIGEVVTKDKLNILDRLNLIDYEGRMDYPFIASMFVIILLLAVVLALYMRMFTPHIFYRKNDLLLLSVVIILTVSIAWTVKEFLPFDWSSYMTFTFIAPVLISIFLDLKLAILVNILLTLCISFMVKDNTTFIMMSVISGSISAFLSANANQRRRISLAGLIVGVLNVIVILCIGIILRKDIQNLINEGGLAFINGLFSVILAIGLLPFLESTFNIITPLKLLELADPNQPLIKKLLMEAPGTYHHSLMVGNLAEVATREIGGNALLARVGAYFHDIGKLKRPNFFKENQMSENPHDRMTPNLSTLVITSHTKDGEEMALKHKIPKAIRDIIVQHHGKTLVAYFYHKAKQGEKIEDIKEVNFRYEGPKPDTRESAVVLLADSVEAAVRSMQDKTKGKIEGLIRKIIKDKLDDGQLDHCELTLKDLNDIANSFLTVLGGFFHERTEYPELERREQLSELDNQPYNNKQAQEILENQKRKNNKGD